MSYAYLTIKREEDGIQTVPQPRVTDVIGQALRGAFHNTNGLSAEMAQMLRHLDAIPHRLN